MIEDEFVVGDDDFDGLAGLDGAAEDFLGERVLQVFLNGAPQGPGTEGRIVALLDEEVERNYNPQWRPHFFDLDVPIDKF